MKQAPHKALTLTLALTALLITGCGRTRPYTYYTLQATETLHPTQSLFSPEVVVVRIVRVPEYARRPQLSLIHPSGELELQDYDRWAEPIEAGIARVLTQQLRAHTPDTTLVESVRSTVGLNPSVTVSVSIDEFKATGSKVHASATWTVRIADSTAVADRKKFSVDTPDQSTAAIVQGYNTILADMSKKILETGVRAQTAARKQ